MAAWNDLTHIQRLDVEDAVRRTLKLRPGPLPLAMVDVVKASVDAYGEVRVDEVEVLEDKAFDRGQADGYQAGWDACLDALERCRFETVQEAAS